LKPDRLRRLATEFLVIVLGVSVALAGESLLRELQDRGAAADYTARLVADLEDESSALRAVARAIAYSREAGSRLLAELAASSLDGPPSDLVRDAYWAGQTWPFSPAGSTWEDLESTGRLGLLSDDVRRPLLAYRRRVERYQEVTAGLPVGFRERVYRLIPAETQSSFRKCIEYRELRPILSTCMEQRPVPGAERLAQVLRDDPRFVGELNFPLPRLEILADFSMSLAE
jgi:hypothetical protein